MRFGDLPRQREAQPIAPDVLPVRRAIEWLEHLVPVGIRDAVSCISHGQTRTVRGARNFDLHRRNTVIVRIFQKVPDKPAQQPWIACNVWGSAGQGARRISGAFFSHQGDEVYVLRQVGVRSGVQAAHQQDLVDQFIQFGDVLLQRRTAVRVAALLQQFHAHADSR